MVTDVLVLMLVLLALLLAVFIYQIVTTPAPAVDAPTVIKSGAAPSAPALAPPDGPRHALPVPAAAWPASQTAPPGASRGRQSSSAALVVGGLAAVILGGWLILRTAPAPGRRAWRKGRRNSLLSWPGREVRDLWPYRGTWYR